MTVDETIRAIKKYPGDMEVFFLVPGEQGRSDSHWPIVSMDDVHSGDGDIVLLRPYAYFKIMKPPQD
jgi:hypothetical protein